MPRSTTTPRKNIAAWIASTPARPLSPTSKALGILEKTDKHKLKVPRGDRTNVVIEPMLTDQWFVAMSKPGEDGKSITEKALDVVHFR